MLQRSSPILSQIDPKSIQKPSWSLSWANAWKKLDFERHRRCEGFSQSLSKTLQDASKTRPRRSQQVFKRPYRVMNSFFAIFDRFFVILDGFLQVLGWFWQGFVKGFRWFFALFLKIAIYQKTLKKLRFLHGFVRLKFFKFAKNQ